MLLLSPLERSQVATERADLLQGTFDMLVLKALQLEPMHGWGITERIE
jgi:PadR family transcriptional regulator, regulatory protein PadR